eukprot:scaffold2319_cov248-Pinguiococcus_pyrenoidosus.AAC.13
MDSSAADGYVDPLRIEDCAQLRLDCGWTLQGYSLGGAPPPLCGTLSIRTGFRLKEIKVLLDAGVACDAKTNGVLLSHCHQDHTYALFWHSLVLRGHSGGTLQETHQSVHQWPLRRSGAALHGGEQSAKAKGAKLLSSAGPTAVSSAGFCPSLAKTWLRCRPCRR